MTVSKIKWTEQTWNPVVGCSKVSAGCVNCYAERMARSLAGMGKEGYCFATTKEGKWSGRCTPRWSAFDKPLKRKKATMYFVCSMGDLFHESVPFEWIDKVFAVMALCPQHTFQVRTKRPARRAEYFVTRPPWNYKQPAQAIPDNVMEIARLGNAMIESDDEYLLNHWPLPNVWLGTTLEHPDYKHRLDDLRKCPAAKRFVSVEPLLADPGELDLAGIDWVICGGESGPGARPMHPDWPRSLRDQCKAAGVPFFFKQWGKFGDAPGGVRPTDVCVSPDGSFEIAGKNYVCVGNESEGEWRRPVGKKKAGSLLDGVEYKEYPK